MSAMHDIFSVIIHDTLFLTSTNLLIAFLFVWLNINLECQLYY